ncbi:MAG: hypothetical protein JZU47_10980 [Prolixibacteraceae bacterium]|nr:hypothetical protein [Prolixibacteraceae bacterium]
MTKPTKIDLDRPDVEVRYMNWLAQISGIGMFSSLYFIGGRGSTKTTAFQAERLQEMVYDMPGAPVALVADTFTNLQKNVWPTLQEGLRLLGWEENIHYVVEKEPLEHWKQRPVNIISSYKHTVVFFNGFNLTFISLDRPSTAAGKSYVAIIGDEVKFFPEHKIAKLTKAVRGYKVKFGNSPFYRSQTFTTDMPNPNLIGEHDWILKHRKRMTIKQIIRILKVGFVYNDIKKEYVIARDSGDRKELAIVKRKLDRWEARWRKVRKKSVFFWVASSFINADILGVDFFSEEFETNLEDVAQAILSLKPKLMAGNRFYSKLTEKHFYKDGNDAYWSDHFGISDFEDCRILAKLNRKKALDAGMDFGNMLSMIVAQDGNKREYNILKEFYTLPPNSIREIADQFIEYFKLHEEKTLNLYYDRAGNNYSKTGQDLASQIKKAIEKTEKGTRTGWKVILRSIGQGTIHSNTEYNFMVDLLSETNTLLPSVRIDQFNCRSLKSSLELAPTKVVNRNGRKLIVKDKRSEGLPIHKLPTQSTNFSDAFKYLLCRKQWLNLNKAGRKQSSGNVSMVG